MQDVHLSHQDLHNILPHAHTHDPAHALSLTCAHGRHPLPLPLPQYKARPQFIHSVNAGPTTVAVVPWALGRVPTHTDFCRPQMPAPAGGLGLELNPSMDEEADHESDWHGGISSKSPLSASSSALTISGLSGFGTDAMLTCSKADLTLHPLSAARPGRGELQVYRSMVVDDTFQLSFRAAFGTSDDVYGANRYPSMPILSTIPLPPEPTINSTSAGGEVSLPPTPTHGFIRPSHLPSSCPGNSAPQAATRGTPNSNSHPTPIAGSYNLVGRA